MPGRAVMAFPIGADKIVLFFDNILKGEQRNAQKNDIKSNDQTKPGRLIKRWRDKILRQAHGGDYYRNDQRENQDRQKQLSGTSCGCHRRKERADSPNTNSTKQHNWYER